MAIVGMLEKKKEHHHRHRHEATTTLLAPKERTIGKRNLRAHVSTRTLQIVRY